MTFTSLPRSRARAATTHFALDARFSPSEALRSLARDYAVVAYGPYWIAETSGPAEPIVGMATVRREPGFFERWFVSSNHALYDVQTSARTTRGSFASISAFDRTRRPPARRRDPTSAAPRTTPRSLRGIPRLPRA